MAAEAELARAQQSGAPPADTRHLLAHARLLQNDSSGALRLAAASAREHLYYAHRVTGLALLAQGDARAAMAAFDRSIFANPRDGAVWLDVARFRRSIGDLQPALAATDRAVAADPRDADALVLRGELTRGQYGLAAALPWFNRALDVDPGHLIALLERAITYGDLGQHRAMLADTRAALAIAPAHPLPLFLQANLAARARDFDLARSLLGRTRGAYDRTPSGMLLGAALAFQARDYDGANRRLEALVERQPGNFAARRLLAAARWRFGDTAATIDALSTIADRADADSYTLTLTALALERQGELGRAAGYRARAARPERAAPAAFVWSDGTAPQVATVAQLLVSGNAGEALARARALQGAMPGSPDVHLVTGDVLAAQRDHRGAADAYRRAANLAFTEAAATRLIGALRRAGDPVAADAVLRLFAAQHPRNLSAQRMLAARALAAGRWAEAAARYDMLRARVGNGDAALLNNLAWALAKVGKDERALLIARRAWALAPGNPLTADTYGWALYRGGRSAEGLALLLAARRGRPEDAVVAPARVAGR